MELQGGYCARHRAAGLTMTATGIVMPETARRASCAKGNVFGYRACCCQYTSFIEVSSPFRPSFCVKTRWLS
jgi:hypothetical protein